MRLLTRQFATATFTASAIFSFVTVIGAAPDRPDAPVGLSRPAAAAATETSAAEIDQLIQQLGSAKATEREAAQKALSRKGEPPIPALQQAVRDADPERADRAAKALKAIEDRQGGPVFQGLRARLRVEQEVWQSGQTPVLWVGVRNLAKNQAAFVGGQQNMQLEFDGQWYEWPMGLRGGPTILPKGQVVSDTPITLSPIWRLPTDKELHTASGAIWLYNETGRQHLTLTPGTHTIRVAMGRGLGGLIGAAVEPRPSLVSNPVEIEVVAAPGGPTPGWPASAELTEAVLALHQKMNMSFGRAMQAPPDQRGLALDEAVKAAQAVEHLADQTPLRPLAVGQKQALLKYQDAFKNNPSPTEAATAAGKAFAQLLDVLTGEAELTSATQPTAE